MSVGLLGVILVSNQMVNDNVAKFGETLKAARLAKNLSQEAVAKELNMLKRHVEALETEEFVALPQFAYLRGFVVNYAKLLGLNTDEIIAQFERVYPASMREKSIKDIKAPLSEMGTLNRGGRNRMRINPWLIAGCVGVLLLIFILLKLISNATKDEPTAVAQAEGTMTLTEQAQGAAIAAVGSTGTIEVRSKGDVNIKITDATGSILLQGNQPRGNYQLQGATPIQVEIDNPAQVDLSFNQKTVRLGEHIKDGKVSLSLQ